MARGDSVHVHGGAAGGAQRPGAVGGGGDGGEQEALRPGGGGLGGPGQAGHPHTAPHLTHYTLLPCNTCIAICDNKVTLG